MSGDWRDMIAPFPDYAFRYHTHGDLVDCLATVAREWRRDNGLWCLTELQYLADQSPWSREVTDWLGKVYAKVRHTQSRTAMFRLHEWISGIDQAKLGGNPHRSGLRNHRMMCIDAVLRPWLAERGQHQWANVGDIGAQHGEMAIHWTGIPGVAWTYAVELSAGNCEVGNFHYRDPRLHFLSAWSDDLPLRDELLDVTICAGVLEHIADPDGTVDELLRVTKPGGLVILQVPYGGMEGAGPNPAADDLGWRSHVRTVDTREYAKNHKMIAAYYMDMSRDPYLPHSWHGQYGESVVAFEKVGR